MHKFLYLIIPFFLLSGYIVGQDFSKPDPTYTTVTLDLGNYSTKDLGLLPFDDAILFIPTFSEDLSKKMPANSPLYLYQREGRCPPFPNSNAFELKGEGKLLPISVFGSPTQTYIYYGASDDKEKKPYHFEPNKRYCLQITDDESKINDRRYNRSAWISAHTASSFSNVVKLDIGVAYVPEINTSFGVVSAHIYFSPINDAADIKITSPESCSKWFWKRFSFFVCTAPFTIISGSKQEIRPLASLGNYGFGIGWRSPFYGYKALRTSDRVYQKGRIFQPIRLNFGVLHYAIANPNPVISQSSSKWSFMGSITYSFGVAALLGPLVKLFG